jgi:hypothetical protein
MIGAQHTDQLTDENAGKHSGGHSSHNTDAHSSVKSDEHSPMIQDGDRTITADQDDPTIVKPSVDTPATAGKSDTLPVINATKNVTEIQNVDKPADKLPKKTISPSQDASSA